MHGIGYKETCTSICMYNQIFWLEVNKMGEHISGWVVMLLGTGIVFIGLIALIFITKIMSALCKTGRKPKEAAAPAPEAAVAAVPAAAQADRGQFVAAIAAAVATAMGTEPSGLRIHSIRKI